MSTTSAIERLKKLKHLLQLERDEDHRIYEEQFLRVGIDQRRKNGVTWYPVKINSEELGTGEYLHLEIERTTDLDKPHQFSSGKGIKIFSNKEDEVKEISAIIKSASKNTLKAVIFGDELPDWCYEGKLGLNIDFDDNSYTEMQSALDTVIHARNCRTADLREMIEGALPLEFEKKYEDVLVPGLNLSQNRAVRHVLRSNDIAVIHGPPGTGKTTSLVQAIRLTLQEENQVLVCAPTNAAIDILSERLTENGITVLRLGHPARISEDLLKCGIDGRIAASPFFKDIKNLRSNAEEYFRMAGKYKRVFGKEEARQRAAYYQEARQCLKEAREIEDHIVSELFRNSQVICCTPVTSTHRGLQKKKFRTLFFDEASQALEPLVWIPLLKCDRLILSGDHHQLPPVVKCRDAVKGGLGETLLDRCMKLEGTIALLNRQYRMSSVIMGFSNEFFYKGELSADDSVILSKLSNDEGTTLYHGLEFIDTAGCGFEEVQNPESLSYSNPGEGDVIFKHLQQLLTDSLNEEALEPIDIGIIAPYKEQVECLRNNQQAYPLNDTKLSTLQIKTIDGFQGEERDVVYISLVRSNTSGEIGFLSDLRRMNVAITRAKKKLVVTGDSSTIGAHPFYKQFLEYCEKHGLYRSAWEWA